MKPEISNILWHEFSDEAWKSMGSMGSRKIEILYSHILKYDLDSQF